MIKFIPLTADEVSFSTRVEPDDVPPETDMDPDTREDILARRELDSDAWCGVIVIATWRGFTARAAIWGNSLHAEYTARDVAEEHGLRDDALDSLNQAIGKAVSDLQPRLILNYGEGA
jgi:hypothetical protein